VGRGPPVHAHRRGRDGGRLSRITRDLAPFTIVAERDEVSGLNLVGLKRRGFSRDVIRELKEAFRAVYAEPGNIRDLAARALASANFGTAEARRFLEFFAAGKRSFARPDRSGGGEESGE